MPLKMMTNRDGTPFYANLHAPSTVVPTVNEAYMLAASLRAQADTMAQMVLKAPDTASAELVEDMRRIALDLKARADAIEAIVDRDKYAQWQASDAAHALRASGGRTDQLVAEDGTVAL